MSDYYLIGLTLIDLELEASVTEAWALAEVSGITSFDCEGTSFNKDAFRMDDVPLFPSLRNLIDTRRTDQKFIFTVVEGKASMQKVIDLTLETVGDLKQPGKGILFVQPLSLVIGL